MIEFNSTDTGIRTISQKELFDLWSNISVIEAFNNYTFSDFENTFQAYIQKEVKQLCFNPKSWEITLSEGLIESSLMAVVLAFLLKSYAESQIPLNILILVLPLLFKIKKITLNDKERLIYLDLVKNQLAYVHAHDVSNLYDNYLSEEIKSNLNKLDFINFLEKLKKMGLVKTIFTDKIIIKSIGKIHIHITIA